MQSDRKKIADRVSQVAEQPLHDARMERPQHAGPSQSPEHSPIVAPLPTQTQAPQELLHTSFSFETPRSTIQRSVPRVSSERIRQIRSSLAVRSKHANTARDRQPNEQTTISVSHGETILDKVMAWIALSLKSLEMRLFSKPQPLLKRNSGQPDGEKERREREAKARQQLKKAMRVRRSRR